MSLNVNNNKINNSDPSKRTGRFVLLRWFLAVQAMLAAVLISATMAQADAFGYIATDGGSPATCAGDSSFNPTINNFVVIDQCTGPNDTFTVQMDISATYSGNKTFWDMLGGFATNDGTTVAPVYNVIQSGCLSTSGGPAPFTNNDGGDGCDEVKGSGGFSLTATQTFDCLDAMCQPVTNQDLIYIIGYTTSNTDQDDDSEITSQSNRKCFANSETVELPTFPIVELFKQSEGGTGLFAFDFQGGDAYGECVGGTAPADNDLDTATEGNPAGPLFIWTNPDPDNDGVYDTDLQITEIGIPAGFELSDISCTGGAGTFDPDTNSITIAAGTDLVPGADLSCTATNKAVYNLELVKEVVLPTGVTIDGYTLAGSNEWVLSAGDNDVVDDDAIGDDEGTIADTLTLQTGTYTLSESGGPSNYTWTSLSCSVGDAVIDGVDINNPDLTLTADTVCTFTNELQVAQISLIKEVATVDPIVDALVADAGDWSLEIGGDYGATDSGSIETIYVPAGETYTLAEGAGIVDGSNPDTISYLSEFSCTDVAGDAATSAVDGGQTGTVAVENGDNVACKFLNTPETTTLTLTKTVVDDFNIPNVSIPAEYWVLNIAIDGGAATPYANGDTITLPKYTSDGVSVTATEGFDSAAWAGNPDLYLSTIQCTGEDATAADLYDAVAQTFTAGLLDTSCTFTNTLNLAKIDLAKTFDDLGLTNGTVTKDSFTMQVLDSSGALVIEQVDVNDLSGLDDPFWQSSYYILPGTGFQVNEFGDAASEAYQWDSTLTCSGSTNSPAEAEITLGTPTSIGDIAAGDEVSCTFDNTIESAKLTLVKSVTGETVDGFTPPAEDAWDLIYGAGGEFLLSGAADNPVTLPKGTYNLSEAYSEGDGKDAFYEWTTLDCGGATDAEGNPIAVDNTDLDLQEDTTCIFTNELQTVTLTLNKLVDDPNIPTVDELTSPAADWPLQFTGDELSGVDLSGEGEISQTVLANSSYDLFEGEATAGGTGSNPDTVIYTTTWSCVDANGEAGEGQTGSVLVGETDVTCTFVNTPQLLSLTLNKNLENNGLDDPVPAGLEGIITDSVDDWNLTADVTLGTASTSQTVTNGVAITLPQVTGGMVASVSEAVIAGQGGEEAYASYVYCGEAPTDPVTSLPSGATTTTEPTTDDVSCTFVNELVTADVVLTKYVDNGDLDGTQLNLAGAGDFDLTFTGPDALGYTDTVSTGTTVTIPVGSYAFSDVASAAYAGAADALDYEYAGAICSATPIDEATALTGSTLATSNAVTEDTQYCYFVNRVTNAQLTIIKDVQNDSGGAAVVEDFTLLIDEGMGSEQVVTSGEATPVTAGDHMVSETWEVEGYTQDSITCVDDATSASIALAGGLVSIAAGQAVTCTIVNVDGVPAIDLVKASTVTEISDPVAGTEIPYTFVFTNTGELPLATVQLTDTNVDAGAITCERADGTSFDHIAGDDLAIGETINCSASYTLTQDDIDGVSANVALIDGVLNLVNMAEVTGLAPDGGEVGAVDDSSVVNIPIVRTAAMDVTKMADVEAGLVLGDVVTYTISVTNTGNTTLSNVTTNDVLSLASGDETLALSGDTLTSGTLSTDGTPDDGVWDSLSPSETVSFTVTYEITQADIDAGDDILNTVNVTSLTSTEETLEGEASVIVAVDRIADISIVKSADKLVELVEGDTVTYSFLVTNEGTVTLTDIIVTDSHVTVNGEQLLTLDAGVLQTDNGAQGDSVKGDAGNGGWDVLAPGDQLLFTATYTITAEDQEAANSGDKTTITNTATVKGKDNGKDIIVDATDTVTVEITPIVDVANVYTLVKTADRTEAERGGVVGYTITVNDTSGDGGIETVKDVLPAGFTYIDGSAKGNFASVIVSEDGRTTTFVDLVVPSGAEPTTIHLQARVSPSVEPGIYTNTASMTYVDGAGNNVTLTDTAKVRINVEAVFDCGDVIGKVYEDRNQDGYQNQGEPGIPNAKLVTADGKIIRADAYGRYHVPCALLPKKIGSNFLLKLDTRSLPTGYRVMTENPRVVRLTPGKMTELNFGVAITQVVRIDLTNAAFDAKGNPTAALVNGVRSVAHKIAKDPSMVRISYYVGTGRDQATNAVYRERMNLVERILRDEWAKVGRYKLNVEKTILRKR